MSKDLSEAQCQELLTHHYYGHLGCTDGLEPYVVPITYLYKDGVVYNATSEGKKVDVLRSNPRMCVQVEELHEDGSWKSVVCWGRFEEVVDASEKKNILLMLAEEYGKALVDSNKAMISPVIERLHEQQSKTDETVVWQFSIDRITGRSGQTY